MTIYKRFTICKKDSPPALYAVIHAFGLEKLGSEKLELEARTGDKVKLWKIAMLVALCRAYGLCRTPQGSPGTYGLDVARNYEPSDFAACDLMLLGRQPKHQIDHARDAEGRLLLTGDFIQGLRIGSAWTHTVVSDEVRGLLESSSLIGLKFREIVPKNPSNKAAVRQFWELQSSIVLPKMLNVHRLMYVGFRDNPPQPFTGDYSRWVFLNDPPYRSGEIHYRRSDLQALGEFDIAETFELYRQPYRELVISQGFYQLCLENDMPLNVEPVRIDAD